MYSDQDIFSFLSMGRWIREVEVEVQLISFYFCFVHALRLELHRIYAWRRER